MLMETERLDERGCSLRTKMTPEVFSALERRALDIQAVIEAKAGPYKAEIVEGVSPLWHLVTTFPNEEERAADHLVERGFGVFVPRFIHGTKLRVPIPVEKRDRFHREAWETFDLSEKLIFPGRILVFVWDVLAHWRRIKACPGVGAVMVDGSERPVVVPDSEIATIQIMQFRLSDPSKPKTRRRQKREHDQDDRLTLSTKSYWAVDGAHRNQLLDKALGLAS
jgi:transcription antitermination factor NusG